VSGELPTAWITHESFFEPQDQRVVGFLGAGGWLEPEDTSPGASVRSRLGRLVAASGLERRLMSVTPREATDGELLAAHASDHVERVRAAGRGRGGEVGSHIWVGPGEHSRAALAAGACVVAVETVLAGRARNAYALVGPPGHHATRASAGGFCVYANVAIAVRRALELGAERVLVVDWDAHHGNGTQEAFWDSADVLTLSIHQWKPFAPGSGDVDALGGDGATGSNLNVPLPPGSGPGAYLEAFERVVGPAARRHEPDLIVVACGLDASTMDPLARMMLHSDAFRELTRRTRELAEELCEGRLVMCHEGGYSTAYAPFCGLAIVEELSGVRTAVEDPFLAHWRPFAGDKLRDHEAAAVGAAARLL
jgi:acetoin utilization deacetylase AcuC-like enzyme